MKMAPFDVSRLRTPPFSLDEAALAWVRDTLDRLSTADKIRQLLLPDGRPFSGAAGIFIRNSNNEVRVDEELERVHHVSGIPLLVAADLEFTAQGRLVQGTDHPCQMAVGATGDPENAARMGRIVGAEGRARGIHWTFSPVADMALNHRSTTVNIRSFGATPASVAAMVAAYVGGVQGAGMAATLKHWPGDGIDERDQHFATSVNSLSMKQWRSSFALIYAAGIAAGVKAIMSAHIALPAYAREAGIRGAATNLPASLSFALTGELLRGELGFNGLVVSDAMMMGGATSQAPWAELAPAMVAAGCDIILFPPEEKEALAYFERALSRGTLQGDRLREAAARVLGFKASLGLHRGEAVESKRRRGRSTGTRDLTSRREHEEWARSCAERSLTLVKDEQKLLPIGPDRTPRILLFHSPPAEFIAPASPFILDELLEDRGFEITKWHDGVLVDQDVFDLLMYVVEEQPTFLAESLTVKWARFAATRAAMMRRYWHDFPVLFISLGNPFHPFEIPACKTIINAYSSSGPTQRALAAALVGDRSFPGTNPVDPFCGASDESLADRTE